MEWTGSFTAGNSDDENINGGVMKNKIIFLVLAAVLFAGCTTTGDIFVDTQPDQTKVNLSELEAAIVPLEALSTAEVQRRRAELTAARQLITGIERETITDADYNAKVMAWSGRLAILENNSSEAQRLHRQSVNTSPGNISAIVLGIRLERNAGARLELIDRELSLMGLHSEGIGELNIEKGRTLFELSRFSEAAGAFDTAFSSGLHEVYTESYTALRNLSWDMRNTAGVDSGMIDMLVQDSINWIDCINIAVNETRLLNFITGGRSFSNTELFNSLVDRGFIPSTQDITVNNWPNARPDPRGMVTRAGAAWFVWHLNAEARAERGMLSRYSMRFAAGANPISPISDVPPLSPFFDSILGCVETELMSLPDGRSFRPELPIRGTEFLSILRRVDR